MVLSSMSIIILGKVFSKQHLVTSANDTPPHCPYVQTPPEHIWLYQKLPSSFDVSQSSHS